MPRILGVICIVLSIGGCVNLGKPEKVAECAVTNTCVNGAPIDGAVTGADTKKDGPTGSDASDTVGTGPDTNLPPPDGVTVGDDTPSIGPDDGGDLSDLPISDTPMLIVDSGSLPEAPLVQSDGPNDIFVALPDGPADRPADGPRDTTTPTDVPVGACIVGGKPAPAGTVCRPAADLCDVAESCDGVNADCPPDKLATAGTVCHAVAGDCDLAESCTGTSAACPPEVFKAKGTVCRATAGLCDVAESCTGTSATCPLDGLAPSGTVCRPSTDTNQCDPAEACTGSSVTCPADVLLVRPAVPTGVGATAGTLQATINWGAVAGATGFNVKRSTTPSGYTTVGVPPTTAASPYVDTGLTGGTLYYYVVSSINTVATCESANSTPAVSVTPTGVCTAPATPAISATPGNGDIVVSWAAVPTAVSYTVLRKVSTGTADYAPVGSAILAPATNYDDKGVQYGTSYSYVVTASNGTCGSLNSNAVTSSPLCSPPATTPTGLTAAIPTLGGQVTLTWTAAVGAGTYQILRKLHTATSYVQIGQVTGTTLTYSDSGLTNGLAYDYVVTSNNGTCSSTPSAVVTTTPQCSVALPVFQTPAVVGDTEVDLTWSAPPGAINYTLSRKLHTAATYAVIAPALTATSYADKDTTLVDGTAYDYVVTASNGNCSSANSAAIAATPVCTPPSPPGALTATPGDSSVNLSWLASPSAPDSYTVQRKTGAGGTYADIFKTPNGTTLSDLDGNLTNGTTYFYQVRANKGSCSSGYDAAQSATPAPLCSQTAPGTPTATVTASTQVQVNWTAATPAPPSTTAGYGIARSLTSNGTYTALGSVGGSVLTFTDTDPTLTVGTTYFYEVTANGASCSATSTPGSVALACSNPPVPGPSAVLNANGSITISWTAVAGATAYTVSRSTSSGGTYTAISSNQTAATYTDSAVTNGTQYFYEVSSSNANHQCTSAQSAATPPAGIRSCTVPTAPTGLSAKRTGNRAVKLVWTNSSGGNLYNVLRSTTSGSGYTSVGTIASSPFTDTNAANGTIFFYVVTAISDAAGNCAPSANSAQVSVPVCNVVTGTGTGSFQAQNSTAEFCAVTCDTSIAWWTDSGIGTRTLFINTVQTGTSGAMPLPAPINSGYAFDFTATGDGSGNFAFWNYGGGTGAACP